MSFHKVFIKGEYMKKIALFLFLSSSLSMGEMVYAAPQKKVIAGPESTVYGIAYENGIQTHALIAANNLKPPYVLQPGQVLIIPSPNEHIVGQGETLKSIADEYGVNVDVLAQENETRAVQQGEHLVIPSRDTESMTQALKPPSQDISTSSLDPLPSVKTIAPAARAGGRVVSPPSKSSGALPSEVAEELAREKGGVAPEHKVDSASSQPVLMGNLAQGNAGAPTAATTTLREEESVEKPKKETKKVAAKETKETKKTKEIEETEETKETTKKEEKSTDKDSPPTKKKVLVDADHIQLIWPVEGTVLKEFAPGKHDGINIKVAEGTAVKAAADGKVRYAGNEVPGFGNLLLLQHEGGWITAYAHNASLLVKKDENVKKGQAIAKSGKTGDAKVPQLHFEVRKGKQPIDPLTQLKP